MCDEQYHIQYTSSDNILANMNHCDEPMRITKIMPKGQWDTGVP